MCQEEINDFVNKYLLNKENTHSNHIYKESYFKKIFPDIYEEISKILFPEEFKFGQKLWHFFHNDYDFDKRCSCPLHGKLKFRDFRRGYAQFCKPHCEAYDKISIEKRKNTRIKNCGSVEESYKRGMEKQKQTCLNRYGVENAGGTKESVEKIISTKLERYGSFDELNKANKIKGDKTRAENYGSVEESYNQSVRKRIETLRNKPTSYFDDIVRKVKNTKKERYGDENYTNIEKHKETCLQKYGTDNYSKTDNFKTEIRKKIIQKTIDKYDEIISINDDTYCCKCIDKDCALCKDKTFEIKRNTFFNRRFYNIDLCTNRTPEKEARFTSGEEKGVLKFIKSIYNGEIIENDRKILKGKELDIFLPDLKLAFEFNGLYWHNEFNKEKDYHQRKSIACIENDIQLIHIWEDDWIHKNEIIQDFIKSKLGLTCNNIGARKCAVKEVSNKEAYEFLQVNHIQGGIRNGNNIGLYYNGELVEIFTFGNMRKSMGSTPSEGCFEIYRVCSKIGYNIQGGFGKLLKYFEKKYEPKCLITYGNLDYTIGNVYIKCGFKSESISAPTYTWVVDCVRRHRTNYMKSKLQECKDNPELTEAEVMHNRGCFRCWDSGKVKFVKYYKR